MYKAIVSGIGSALPSRTITNADLENWMETSDEWISTRTGISERKVIADGENTSVLAIQASKNALRESGLKPTEIDLIIVASETPDHMFPPTAVLVQKELGFKNIGAFDIHSTCVGFITGLQMAEQHVKIGKAKHVLVIGADALSKIVDYSDRSTAVLFADGAGAFVISRSETKESQGIIDSSIHSNGDYYYDLYVDQYLETNKPKIKMNGNTIFKLAVSAMSESVKDITEKNWVDLNNIDWLIPHQANQRIIDGVGKNLNFPSEKVISTIKWYGNNSAATIPIAMDTAKKEGKIKKGDNIVLTAFGGGLIWGSLLLQY